MFFDKTSEDEFFSSLESKLEKQHNREDNIKNTRLNKVDVHLHKAAELFDEIGFEKEAKVIRLLLKKKLMKPQKA